MKHLFLFNLANFIIAEFTGHKALIAFIVIGLVAGLVAQLIIPGRGYGLVATAVMGILGCYLSNMFLVSHITFIEQGILRELIGAIVFSALIQLAVSVVIPRRDTAR